MTDTTKHPSMPASGESFSNMMKEFARLFAQAKRQPLEAAHLAVRRLAASGVVNASDSTRLDQLCEIVMGASTPRDHQEARVRALHDEMIRSGDAGEVTITIVGTVLTTIPIPGNDGIPAGALGGALIGACVATATSGESHAGRGAVVGALAGAGVRGLS